VSSLLSFCAALLTRCFSYANESLESKCSERSAVTANRSLLCIHDGPANSFGAGLVVYLATNVTIDSFSSRSSVAAPAFRPSPPCHPSVFHLPLTENPCVPGVLFAALGWLQEARCVGWGHGKQLSPARIQL
jgi:hypothetical protein